MLKLACYIILIIIHGALAVGMFKLIVDSPEDDKILQSAEFIWFLLFVGICIMYIALLCTYCISVIFPL